jgi:hypothetical protein
MSFKIGDKVRLRDCIKKEIRKEALAAIVSLNTNGVFTIDQVVYNGTKYIAKEFDRPWKWDDKNLELIKHSSSKQKHEPINDRFEILDL